MSNIFDIRLTPTAYNIIINTITENSKHIVVGGDLAMNMQLLPEFRKPIFSIGFTYKKNEKKTREFVLDLANKLLNSGEQVRIINHGYTFRIESFKDNEWNEIVVVGSKGFVIT